MIAEPVILVGRFLLALLFVVSGLAIHRVDQVVALSRPLVIARGISILLAYRVEVGMCLLFIFLACLTPIMHTNSSMTYQTQFVQLTKDVSMLNPAVLSSQIGAGP
jgi:uncharacterized membrane protein YphA (DoxX/SURF4 family)